MHRTCVVGSRGSPLALRQTEDVLGLLRRLQPEMGFDIQTVHTTADRRADASFEQLPGVGFFVKELEMALLETRIDAAVHSMKDLPTLETPGLAIAAIPEREDPRDVLVARDGLALEELPRAARVGTSSPRRAAFLRAARPDLQIVPVRGNVDTRIRKVDAGDLDAVCLAAAGLRRLGLEGRVTERLPVELMLPAPGQGALGVQVRADDGPTAAVIRRVDNPATRRAVEAERAVLGRLEGGCRLPVGAHGVVEEEHLALRAAVIALDGSRVIQAARTGAAADAVVLGRDLADELLDRGAASLMPAAEEARR